MNNNKKIAFCFLLTGDWYLEPIWEYFLQSFSAPGWEPICLIHCADGGTSIKGKRFEQVPWVPTSWAQTVNAQLSLLKVAQSKGCDYAFLLSETCLPIMRQDILKAELVVATRFESALNIHVPANFTKNTKDADKKKRVIYCDVKHHRMHEQWWALNRSHIDWLLECAERGEVNTLFKDTFADNEHWIGTLASIHDKLNEFIPRCRTYTKWENPNARHPIAFHGTIEPIFWSEAFGHGCFFMRKFARDARLQPVCQTIAPNGKLQHFNEGVEVYELKDRGKEIASKIQKFLESNISPDLPLQNTSIIAPVSEQSVPKKTIDDVPVHIFYHLYAANDWYRILQEQVYMLQLSKIKIEQFWIFVTLTDGVDGDIFVKIVDNIGKALNVIRVSLEYNDKNEWEFPTLRRLKYFIDTNKVSRHVLYLHSKGTGTAGDLNKQAWRRAMENVVIFKHRECRQGLLDGCDIAGTTWLGPPNNFFPGNFWWATSEYIHKLMPFDDFVEHFKKNIKRGELRMAAEDWVGAAQPKVKNFNQNLHIWHPHKYIASKFWCMNDHVAIINQLIETRGVNSYLEIGVYDPKLCFNLIKVKDKTGVDPVPGVATFTGTSDTFFAQNERKFDLVFIDGLHTEEQVTKDIENALAVLNEGGLIVLHDCYPPDAYHQRPVEQFKVGEAWCGTVWKAVATYCYGGKYQCRIMTQDYGIGIIDTSIENKKPKKVPKPLEFENMVELLKPFVINAL